MPVLTDEDVGLGSKELSDADVGLIGASEPTESEKAAASLADTRKLIRETRQIQQEGLARHPNLEAATLGLTEAMQEPVVSPETLTCGAAAISRNLPSGFGPTLGPSAPGSARRGAEELAGETAASLTVPTTAAAIALTPVAPQVMLPYFGYQGYKDIPGAVAQAVEGETPAEKVKGAGRALLDVGMVLPGLKTLGVPIPDPIALRREALARTAAETAAQAERANRAAVNLAAPGTLRPQEQTLWAKPEVEAPEGMVKTQADWKDLVPKEFHVEVSEGIQEAVKRIKLAQQRAVEVGAAGKLSEGGQEFQSVADKPGFLLTAEEKIARGEQQMGREAEKPTVITEATPIKDVEQIVRTALEKKDWAEAVSTLAQTKAEVSGKIVNDLLNVGKDKVPLSAAQRTIFNTIWDEAVKKAGGEPVSKELTEPKGRPEQVAAENTEPPKPQGTAQAEGESLFDWADRILAQDPRTKTRMLLDPVEQAKMIAALAVKGAQLLAKGAKDFGTWSKAMLEAHGAEIKPFLRQVYDASSKSTIIKDRRSSAELISEINNLQSAVASKKPLESWTPEDDLIDDIADTAHDIVSGPLQEFEKKTGTYSAKRLEEGQIGLSRMMKGEASETDLKAVQQFVDPTQSGITDNVTDLWQDMPLEEASKVTAEKLADIAAEEITGNIGGDRSVTKAKLLSEHGEALDSIAKRMRESATPQFNEAMMNHASELANLRKEQSAPSNAGNQNLGIALGAAQFRAIGEKLSSLRDKLVNSWATRGNKADIARTKDAADNQAKIYANQAGRSILLDARKTFGTQADQALRAVIPVIESGGDRAHLAQFITQSTGKNVEAMQAAKFADANWDRLQPLANKIKTIHDAEIAEENANGIATTYRENYIKHAFDVEKLPNRGEEFFGSTGGVGTRSGFKAARKFETLYDAIEAGYGDAIKSMDAAKLTESRLASGQQLINDRQWVRSFRNVTDPTTNKPIIRDVTFDQNHFPTAPAGYEAVPVLPGQFVAIHNGYRGIFDAVTGGSKLAGGEIAGLPIGQAIMSTAAGIKHGLLLFDTFHASRIMQKQFFLTGKVGWKKGLSLLEYNDADLNEAVRQGEITPEMANYARAERPKMILLTRNGLNVGRIQEALRSEVIRNLPVVGTFNKWVFDKVTRGAVMEAAITELDRVAAQNTGMTPQQLAATVAKKINVTFGNIGRQGLFKSRTMQDLSRLVALAPQWVESMARSEIGGFKELAKVPVDLAMGKGLQVGTLGKTMAGGLLAYVVGTQLLNLATRGHFTWDNKEEGHKLDAWIPDVTGKTPGFFLNPLSVVAELTHDAYRFAFKKDNALEVAGQIAANKASPLMRSQYTLWSGKNYSGEKIDGTWNRIKEAGSALVPAPIPVSGFTSPRPGQAQRQLTASAGIKTEPAPTALKQISDKAAQFTKDKGKPKEVDLVYHAGSPHNVLRNAIERGDDKAAMEAIEALRKTQTDAKIFQSWRQSLTHPFAGSQALEMKFRQSLSEDDKKLYEAARKEKQKNFARFTALWARRQRR